MIAQIAPIGHVAIKLILVGIGIWSILRAVITKKIASLGKFPPSIGKLIEFFWFGCVVMLLSFGLRSHLNDYELQFYRVTFFFLPIASVLFSLALSERLSILLFGIASVVLGVFL